ncbi:P-loop containing nucleoside triphosphate hydrolase protein, partial [Baffinella frigidus]
GSGKTAAFMVPLIVRVQRLREATAFRDGDRVTHARGLVLSPTRELALQTFNFFKTYSKFTELTGCLLAGGEALDPQFAALATYPDVIIATPGRLLQLLNEVSSLSLRNVRVCVMDEADRLFEGGLAPEVEEIVRAMEPQGLRILSGRAARGRQSSANRAAGKAAGVEEVEGGGFRVLSPTLRVAFYHVLPHEKCSALLFLLRHAPSPNDAPDAKAPERTLVFCATRHSVDLLRMVLVHAGVRVGSVHGGMDQAQRHGALEAFKSRDVEVLVVTDVAARGLDVPLLDAVVNFDFPATPKLLVHRAGRAGLLHQPFTLDPRP